MRVNLSRSVLGPCLFLAVTSTILSTLGCAAYSGRPLVESGVASSYLEHAQRDGLHVAVIDLSSSRDTVKHFGTHLPDHGFMPVELLVELDSQTSSAFNIRRDDIHLVLQDGTRLPACDPHQVVDAAAFSHWRSFFGFLLIVPGPFVASSVSSANKDLENDYLQKSLRNVRISHNMRVYRGVVFFEIPQDLVDEVRLQDAFVEIVAEREANAAEAASLGERVEFPVHFSR